VKAAVYPEDQERAWRNMQDCLNGKSVPPDQDYRPLRNDGTVRWVEALSSRIEYQGKPTFLIAIVGITERKQREQERAY